MLCCASRSSHFGFIANILLFAQVSFSTTSKHSQSMNTYRKKMIHGNACSLENKFYSPGRLQNSARDPFTIVEIYGMFTFETLLRLWTDEETVAQKSQSETTSLDNNDVEEKENCATKDV